MSKVENVQRPLPGLNAAKNSSDALVAPRT
jgi:hypothetical protein